MTETTADDQCHELLENPASSSGAGTGNTKLTLEEVVTMTGELEHLNELVLLHVEKSGGFSGTSLYFMLVTPILDQLENEIRSQSSCDMTTDAIKEIIHVWIDRQIGLVTSGPKKNPEGKIP